MGAEWKVINRNYKNLDGYKRVAWPPASEERIVHEFTPQPQTQYQPEPVYNQQHQPSAVATGSAMPPTQNPIYKNVQHNTNNFPRELSLPLIQNSNLSDNEAFPPQTPETPIILKDKQFSRLPSQENNQTNNIPFEQYQQPQNEAMQHQGSQQRLTESKEFLYNQQNYHQQKQQRQATQHSVSQSHHHQQQQYQYQNEYNLQHICGRKPTNPPQVKSELSFTRSNGIRESTHSVGHPSFQQQSQNYHLPPTHQQQQYRAPSYDNYQQYPQQQQYPQPGQYQGQAPPATQNIYQPQPQAGSCYQPPAQQQGWPQQQPHQQHPQQQYQQPPWMQQAQGQQPQQQSQYQKPFNQYNQAPHHQQQQQYPLQQNQFVPQANQQQFNSYSQPQPHQQPHTVSHDQVDQQNQCQPHLSQNQRGASPGIITLRKEAPITQKPAPIYTAQPAATSFRESSIDSVGGSSMRGDLKWPPPEYKEAAAKENEERRKLALGPVCRPRKVNRDYTSFFAKNALSHHYPSYKVPPGTQHMIN